ncbi:hypothetical protein CEB3_c20640 [Peptococcaceae bacterium CEB3]|nr:hypothetical protein CEB3_c20640 [Peptococcaceae bacterium CEB3]
MLPWIVSLLIGLFVIGWVAVMVASIYQIAKAAFRRLRRWKSFFCISGSLSKPASKHLTLKYHR